MRRKIGSMILIAGACAACKSSPQISRDTASQNTPGAQVTVIGCVQPSDQSTQAPAATDTKYTLTHAKPGTSNSGQPTGTTGNSTEPSAASTYRLDAPDAKLSPEVGHQVEIVAIVAEPDTAASSGAAGSANSSASAPKLQVQTVRMIAMTCPE